ncbi:MAG: bifunctional riboflavin kinase/FAD synthetase [Armatimonadota bacterium]|nr:bifunctional riboflavin kinase/FAD synthetase [Armatimonadota bacterium]
MSVYDLESVSGELTRTAVTVGMFDGVHLGHRALLEALREEARRIHGQSVVLTFDRHPSVTLRPEKAPKFINTLEQRLAALDGAGVDAIVVATFDRAISEMSPREFFEEILLRRLKTAVVVVGPDFRFGKNRAGDFATMSELGLERGVAAVAIAPIRVDEAPVSSTRIRTLLRHGAVEQAGKLLGRPFVLEGVVVKGAGLGKKLGFPTANLQIEDGQLIPGQGVYSADAVARNSAYPAVASIGSRPTVGGTGVVVEAHIVGFDEDIYGEHIRLGFRARLRDQRKFASLDALVEQMRRDLETVPQPQPAFVPHPD